MATTVFETLTCTGTFTAIKSSHYGFRGALTAAASNGGNILMRLAGSGAAGVPLTPGTTKQCWMPTDLNLLEVSGNGNVLIIDGNTDKGW